MTLKVGDVWPCRDDRFEGVVTGCCSPDFSVTVRHAATKEFRDATSVDGSGRIFKNRFHDNDLIVAPPDPGMEPLDDSHFHAEPIIRRRIDGALMHVVNSGPTNVLAGCCGELLLISYEQLRACFDRSYDCGATWLPCEKPIEN